MYFSNLHELFFMNGHGLYVWSSYLFFFLMIGLYTINTIFRKKHTIKIIKTIYKQETKNKNIKNRQQD